MAKVGGEGDIITSIGKVRDKQPTEILGPCIVSIGSPLVTHIKFEASQNMISNYKTKYVIYRMYLFNGKKGIGHIGICHHEHPYLFNPVVELRDFVEPQYGNLRYRDVFTYEIYDGTGAITICRNPLIGVGKPKEQALFMYRTNDVTNINGALYLSQEEAEKLIYSIHVEMREKTAAPEQVAASTRDDPVQRLKQLKEALDAGLITEGEFQEKRQAIISKM